MPIGRNRLLKEIIELAERHGYSSWLAVGHCVRGWARSCFGDVAAGFAETRQGYDAYRASGALAALTSGQLSLHRRCVDPAVSRTPRS